MKELLREYSAHTALNLGQAARDLRFFYYHPGADELAVEGSPAHMLRSLPLRARSLANNVFFSTLPPHLHHTAKELKVMRRGSHAAWFLHGYMPWRFPLPKK